MMRPVKQIVHSHLNRLHPYTPGKQPSGEGWIKLNTNELPYAPPPAVGEAIASEIPLLARYPNPPSWPLREALAEFYGFGRDQVIIGNGSDDLLNLLVRAFGGAGRKTVDTFPSYSLYPVINAIAAGRIHSVSFGPDFALPVEQLIDTEADLLFLTCPNAPTGVRFPTDQLSRLAGGCSGLLVIDEAYAEFAEGNALGLLREYPNVVITRTFSKAYGLAGLRVGYAFAPPEVIDYLDRIRDSYNVNRLSQAGALAALRHHETYAGYIARVKDTRRQTSRALTELGWHVHPSEANFLFGAPAGLAADRAPEAASSLFEWLEARRILVRHFPNHPLTAGYLRISIGSPSEMERFIEEVRQWHKGA